MKTAKKLVVLMVVLAMVFALSTTAFAAGTGTVAVKIYVPEKVYDPALNDYAGGYYNFNLPSYYTDSGLDVWDELSEAYVNLYSCTGNVSLTQIDAWPVSLPTGFNGLYNCGLNDEYIPTAFDVIYNLAVTQKGETPSLYGQTPATPFVYGFDTYSTPNGVFASSISGIDGYVIYTDYVSYWAGYGWMTYVVPNNTTFNPENPDATYLTSLYSSNIPVYDGYTVYMILDYSEQSW